MMDHGMKPRKRSSVAARFDEITLAAVTVLLLVTVVAVITMGMPTAGERIGCGLNGLVNRLLAYPRTCR